MISIRAPGGKVHEVSPNGFVEIRDKEGGLVAVFWASSTGEVLELRKGTEGFQQYTTLYPSTKSVEIRRKP